MIVRPRPSFIQLLFITRGSIVPDIIGQIIAAAVVAALVVLAHKTWPNRVPVFNGAPFALIGIALSLFLGFRTNACDDRWWEARRHWGEMIAVARGLARTPRRRPCRAGSGRGAGRLCQQRVARHGP